MSTTPISPPIDLPRLQSLISDIDAAIDKSDGNPWTRQKELGSLESDADHILRHHPLRDALCSRMKQGDASVLGDLQQIEVEAKLAAK